MVRRDDRRRRARASPRRRRSPRTTRPSTARSTRPSTPSRPTGPTRSPRSTGPPTTRSPTTACSRTPSRARPPAAAPRVTRPMKRSPATPSTAPRATSWPGTPRSSSRSSSVSTARSPSRSCSRTSGATPCRHAPTCGRRPSSWSSRPTASPARGPGRSPTATPTSRSGATISTPRSSGFLQFRDPPGVDPSQEGAHGNTFDRVRAFQDGFEGSASSCRDYESDPPSVTESGYDSQVDAANGGDLPLRRHPGSAARPRSTPTGRT